MSVTVAEVTASLDLLRASLVHSRVQKSLLVDNPPSSQQRQGRCSPLGASADDVGRWWNRKRDVEIDVECVDESPSTTWAGYACLRLASSSRTAGTRSTGTSMAV